MSSSFSHKTVNAYRNSAKKVANNPNLKNILQRAQLKDKKKLSLSQIQSDNENEEPPDFDCNAGVRLSDSSDDEEILTSSKVAKKTIPQEEPKMKSNPVKDSIEKSSSSGSAINMNKILQNLQEAEKDTEQLRNIQTKRLNINQETDNMNISQLLMLELGETGSTAKSSKKRTQDEMDSDSDEWEEVEGKKIKIPEHRLKVRKLLKKFRYEE